MSSTSRARYINLEQVLDEQVDWRHKSFPTGPPTPIRDVASRGWNALGGEFMLPVMVLKDSSLRHNIDLLASYCRRHQIELAPHGKASMSPQLLKLQLDGGAWGVTAATMSQVRVWRAFGVDRIILANELVEPASVHWIASEMTADPGFVFYCLVDSVAAVQLLESALGAGGLERRLPVLLEVGPAGGRTGTRTPAQALAVARAVAGSRHLELVGVETFEGVIHAESLAGSLEAVDRLLREMRALVTELDGAALFGQVPEVLVTAGGSAYPDRVVAELGPPWELSRPVRLVLRSGCYLAHDAVHYRQLSPFGGRIPETGPLEEALEVWGAVLSVPEPGLALVGLGKHDVSHDLDLPVPRLVKSGTRSPRPIGGGASIFSLSDHHAFLRFGADEDLRVGDLVGCGISHPCTAFDKWRLIPVVDDRYNVTDAVLTYF